MDVKRNYGLDILRILSMLGIVGLHILGQGGILKELSSVNGFLKYDTAYFIEILLYCSVNIFAMITGYLYITYDKVKSKSIINILLNVIFYSVLITAVIYIFNIYSIRQLRKIEFVKALIIPFNKAYWYVSCYLVIFFLIPYLNLALNKLSKKKFETLIGILLVFFSFLATVITEDVFKIDRGYTIIWLLVCYIIGAYIKLYGIKTTNRKKLIAILVISTVLVLIFRRLMQIITPAIFERRVYEGLFMAYNSPFILINSIVIFLIFKDIDVKNSSIKKMLINLSKTSFSVYIIHCQYFVFNYLLAGRFKYLAHLNVLKMTGGLVMYMLLIYLVCSIVDFIKIKLFDLCRVDKLVNSMGTKLDKYIN